MIYTCPQFFLGTSTPSISREGGTKSLTMMATFCTPGRCPIL